MTGCALDARHPSVMNVELGTDGDRRIDFPWSAAPPVRRRG